MKISKTTFPKMRGTDIGKTVFDASQTTEILIPLKYVFSSMTEERLLYTVDSLKLLIITRQLFLLFKKM